MTLAQRTQALINEAIRRGVAYYHPGQKCYKRGTTPLRGASKALADRFWPTYRVPRNVGGGGRGGGLLRGKIVDRQLTVWAQTKRVPRTMHTFSRKIIEKFRSLGWTPWRAQVVVDDRAHNTRLGTAIDMILRDRQNQVIYVEIKAGYHGYWRTAQGFMEAPLSHIESCPLNHACLQLALGIQLARGCIPYGPNKAYVVQVEVDGVFLFELPQWSVDAIKLVMPF